MGNLCGESVCEDVAPNAPHLDIKLFADKYRYKGLKEEI